MIADTLYPVESLELKGVDAYGSCFAAKRTFDWVGKTAVATRVRRSIGYGEPSARTPEAIARDIRDGYPTSERALEVRDGGQAGVGAGAPA